MSTVRFTFEVDDVLTDATSVVLSDETGTFGIKRDDTDAVVVADGTAMTKTGTGVYEHTFDDPSGFYDSTYTWAVEAVDGGETYRWQYTKDGPATPASTASTTIRTAGAITWQDLIDHGMAWLGLSNAQADENIVKRAVKDAYRRVAGDLRLDYVQERARITLVAPYETGTVAVTNGSCTVTLTSGTWPSWAGSAELAVNGAGPVYQVASRDSDSQITLCSDTPFDGTTDTDATYSLQRVTYDLPADFGHGGEMHLELVGDPTYVAPEEWLDRRRGLSTTTGTPTVYTVIASPDTRQRYALGLHPAPNEATTVDFLYRRRPRDMNVNYATGTITVTADSATVTGSGTSWISDMGGAVLRIGDASNIPTGQDGEYPFAEEHYISSVGGSGSITLETAAENSAASVYYRICDYVDLDEWVTLPLLHRAVEFMVDQCHPARRGTASNAAYKDALQAARAAKPRASGSPVMGPSIPEERRLRDWPYQAP